MRGVAAFEFKKPVTLEPRPRLDTNGGYANKVTVYDRKLCVANDYKGISVFDIHSPREPKPIP